MGILKQGKTLIFIAFLALIINNVWGSGDLIITEKKVNQNGMGSIVFNDNIEIFGLFLKIDNKLTLLETPSNIKFVDENLKNSVMRAISGQLVEKKDNEPLSYKIAEISYSENTDNVLRGSGKVIFNESFEISFTILDQANKLWVILPKEVKFQNSGFRIIIEKNIEKNFSQRK